MIELHTGDCLDVLKTLPDCSVDAVITDPPYGLSNTKPAQVADVLKAWVTGDTVSVPAKRGGFMGKDWDSFVPPPAVWEECMRVLKPGGHMAVFAGSRTQDLMGLSIRLAGFEIRDTLGWVYSQGFPKSMDISKAIDRSNGENRKRQHEFTGWMRSTGITAREINEATGTSQESGHLLAGPNHSQPHIATADLFDKLRPLLPEVPERIERLVAERTGIEWTDYVKREVVGVQKGAMSGWDMDGTTKFADRNITTPATSEAKRWDGWGTSLKPAIEPIVLARKPLDGTVAANVLLDEHAAAGIDGQSDDSSRFFPVFKYQAKAPRRERPVIEREDGTKIQHPTVKPVALVEWLVTLITPPNGVVLDPFAGSGSTLEATRNKGFNSIGIEREADYIRLIEARLDHQRAS